jgi:hypothetical protein
MTNLRFPTVALAAWLGFGLFSLTGQAQAGPLLDRMKQQMIL